MNDEASAFLTSVKARTASLSASCPGFEVFALTETKLLTCIRTLDFHAFSGPDYMVMSRLGEELRKLRNEDALWGLAYVDLWYCSNFSAIYWTELVRLNPQNIRFAIQAALYVWWSSGSDGSRVLAGLINTCSCSAEAREYVASFPGREEWRGWFEALLRQAL